MLIEDVLHGMSDVNVYIDDIGICSNSYDEWWLHVHHIKDDAEFK